MPAPPPRSKVQVSRYVAAAAIIAVAAVLGGALFRRSEPADIAMVFLLGIVVVSMRFGLGPSILAAVLSVLAFDFFIIPPRFTFAVEDPHHIVTFAVMFLVAIVIGGLTQRVRSQAEERARLAEEAQNARVQADTEKLRSTLLSSVSHDLRTPLAVITGSASTLVHDDAVLDAATRTDLAQTILEEAERLNRLIRNLLDMTRLESGAVKVRKEWQPLEEVVGAALGRADARLSNRDVQVRLPADLPLAPFDGVLVEQVLINLLENAAKYSGGGSIEITAAAGEDEIVVQVADRGPGIPAGDEARVFEKFHRAVREGSPGGVGLGLAICRAIVDAHGGRLWAENRPGGGASFQFALPIEGQPPELSNREPPMAGARSGGEPS